MCKGSCLPGKSTTFRGKSGMRPAPMGHLRNDTRRYEGWLGWRKDAGNRKGVGESAWGSSENRHGVSLHRGASGPDGVGAANCRSRAQGVADVVERRGGEDFLEIHLIGIAPLGDAASENRKVQRFAPERVRVDGELVVASRAHKEIDFLALVI